MDSFCIRRTKCRTGVRDIIYQDNLGCIKWTSDVQGLRNVTHVALSYHYIGNIVEPREIKVVYTPSAENKADSLTKILGRELHAVHRLFLGVVGEHVEGAC